MFRAIPLSTHTRNVGNTNVTYYPFHLEPIFIIGSEDDSLEHLLNRIDNAITEVTNANQLPLGTRYSVVMIGNDDQYTQTPYTTRENILNFVTRVIRNIADKYRSDAPNEHRDIIRFEITWYPPMRDTSIITRSGEYNVTLLSDYCIVSPGSITNCGFSTLALGIRIADGIKENDIPYIFDNTMLRTLGANLKAKYPQFRGVDACSDEMLKFMAVSEGVHLRVLNSDRKHLIINHNVKCPKKVVLWYHNGHITTVISNELLNTAPLIKSVTRLTEAEKSLTDVYPEGQEENVQMLNIRQYINKHFSRGEMTPEAMDEFLYEEKYCVRIEKKYKANEYNMRIAAWDSETTNTKEDGTKMDQKPYCCGYAYYDFKELQEDSTDERTPWKIVYHYFPGTDCMSDMMTHIHENLEILAGYTFYAHNGSKFDLQVFMQYGMLSLKEWTTDKAPLSRDGAILKYTFVSRTTGKCVHFLDSVRIIPGTLKSLLRETKTQHQKLDFDHNKVNEVNCLDNPLLESYQKNDVIGLLELMHIFSKCVWDSLQVNITDCVTAASMAKRNYFQNYYDPYKKPIYKLPSWLDKFLRSGYNGGRVEAAVIGHLLKKFFYYDVTSLYPSEARKVLPYGIPHLINPQLVNSTLEEFQRNVFRKDPITGKTKLVLGLFGFVRVLVKGPTNGKRPLHSIYSNNKLLFPIFDDWTETVLFTEELRMSLDGDLGYEYQALDLVTFKGSTILKSVMEDGFKKKAEEASKGNSTSAAAQKIVINSTYGFFGLVAEEVDTLKIYKKTDPIDIDTRINAMMVEDRFISSNAIGDYNIVRCITDLKIKDFNVAIASAITAYSRMSLYRIMELFEKDGASIYYYDTDSVVVDKSIKDCPNVIREFQTDGCGVELGMLKNECTDILKKRYKETPEKMQKELEIEPEPYFEEMVLLGCKNYALRRKPRFEGGTEIEILKMKGIKNGLPLRSTITRNEETGETEEVMFESNRTVCFDDYVDLSKGSILTQDQDQFKAGSSTIMDVRTSGGSRIVNVKKNLSMLYNKGTLIPQEEGYSKVTPLHIGNVEDPMEGLITHKNARYPGIETREIIVKKIVKNRADKPKKRKEPSEREESSKKRK